MRGAQAEYLQNTRQGNIASASPRTTSERTQNGLQSSNLSLHRGQRKEKRSRWLYFSVWRTAAGMHRLWKHCLIDCMKDELSDVYLRKEINLPRFRWRGQLSL